MKRERLWNVPAEGEEPWATKFEFVVDMSNTQKFNNVRGLLECSARTHELGSPVPTMELLTISPSRFVASSSAS